MIFAQQTRAGESASDSHKIVIWNAPTSGVTDGRFFQITPEGDIVWECVPPYAGKRQVGGKAFLDSLVFQARAVPYD
jgi:hypothetical protein